MVAGGTGPPLRTAPDLHRFGGARRAESVHSQSAPPGSCEFRSAICWRESEALFASSGGSRRVFLSPEIGWRCCTFHRLVTGARGEVVGSATAHVADIPRRPCRKRQGGWPTQFGPVFRRSGRCRAFPPPEIGAVTADTRAPASTRKAQAGAKARAKAQSGRGPAGSMADAGLRHQRAVAVIILVRLDDLRHSVFVEPLQDTEVSRRQSH
jgi:hypothetical protein